MQENNHVTLIHPAFTRGHPHWVSNKNLAQKPSPNKTLRQNLLSVGYTQTKTAGSRYLGFFGPCLNTGYGVKLVKVPSYKKWRTHRFLIFTHLVFCGILAPKIPQRKQVWDVLKKPLNEWTQWSTHHCFVIPLLPPKKKKKKTIYPLKSYLSQ